MILSPCIGFFLQLHASFHTAVSVGQDLHKVALTLPIIVPIVLVPLSPISQHSMHLLAKGQITLPVKREITCDWISHSQLQSIIHPSFLRLSHALSVLQVRFTVLSLSS